MAASQSVRGGIGQRSEDSCMTTVPELLDAGVSLINGLFPGLIMVLGITIGLGLVVLMSRELTRTIGATLGDREKQKNDHNLALLDAPEKPKRMFVRLGDDGELVEWSENHETNSQV
jgi:hypothetical protein